MTVRRWLGRSPTERRGRSVLRSRRAARGSPPLPAFPAGLWEEIASAAVLRVIPVTIAATAEGHRLTLSALKVGRTGARLTFTLVPPWLPARMERGQAPLPRPAGTGADRHGTTYTLVPGPSEADGRRMTGELLLHPPPGPDAGWLDLDLSLGGLGAGQGPAWRVRLALE